MVRAYTCYPLGDSAIVVKLGDTIEPTLLPVIRELADFLERHRFPGFIELVPAYTTITIYYDVLGVAEHAPGANAGARASAGASARASAGASARASASAGAGASASANVNTNANASESASASANAVSYTLRSAAVPSPYDQVAQMVQHLLDMYESSASRQVEPSAADRIVHIPLCYGGEYGPDLSGLAFYHGLSEAEVIDLHTSRDYPVYMIGFAPGFPYLGGLDERLATPRRSVPRIQIPAGSVAIGGAQTGIYPLMTPGGWHVIGRTPLALFRPDADPPSLLQAGDIVRFVPIAPDEYETACERN